MSINLVGGDRDPRHARPRVPGHRARRARRAAAVLLRARVRDHARVRPPRADHRRRASASAGSRTRRVLSYDGPVYNLEVEEDQTYLVHGAAVHNCQNWITSQALRDPRAMAPPEESRRRISCARPSGTARASSPPPTTSRSSPASGRWPSSAKARPAGLVCSYVSNGNGTPEVLDYIRPWVSLYKVDLKSFRDRSYRELGGTLDRVLWTIRALHEQGFWLEIVTLVDPRLQRLRRGADARSRGSWSRSRPDIPWHVTAFHKDYKMTGARRHVGGDAPARGGDRDRAPACASSTRATCPGASGAGRTPGARAAARCSSSATGFRILRNVIPDGDCPECGRHVPGFWERDAAALAAWS